MAGGCLGLEDDEDVELVKVELERLSEVVGLWLPVKAGLVEYVDERLEDGP